MSKKAKKILVGLTITKAVVDIIYVIAESKLEGMVKENNK